MTRAQILLASLALAAPLVIGGGIASAQRYPQEGSRDGSETFRRQRDARRLNVLVGSQLVRKTGVVQSFVYVGRSVRGVRLADGTTVLLRGNPRSFLRGVRVGSVVRVRGFVMPAGDRTVVRRASIAAITRRDMRSARYAPAPTPVAAPDVTTAPIVARGIIRTIVRSPNGRTQSLILTDGVSVRLPDSMANALSIRGVQAGERVAISARLVGANPGMLVADTLTFSDGTTFRSRGR